MSKNPNLNDLQLILLATAVQREDGSILPPPDSIGDQAERIRKAIPALLRRKLIEEVPVTKPARAWRQEDDRHIGLAITDAGRAIIAAEEETIDEPEAPARNVAVPPGADEAPGQPAPRSGSKTEMVLGLLRREEGATLAELVEATGWLPHTTRAALTGLRKKGHVVDKGKRGDATCYRIKASA